MIIEIEHNGDSYSCDLSTPLDISIPVGEVKCFYAPDLKINPFVSGDFVGSVKAGAPVNFFNVSLNPHGNGTHTESLGHITLEQESVNDCLKQYHFIAQLITVELTEATNGDKVVTEAEVKTKCPETLPDALIIRTKPNDQKKRTTDYSGSNPPYLTKESMEYIVEKGVNHLLIDLPSVDREEDDGKLKNHRLFWKVDTNVANLSSRIQCTITELIYVPNEIKDGLYFLNVQMPSLVLDAVPSKPVLYRLDPVFY
ncbi:MAG: cyclase family protein [Saprospiraceae bacterium]